MNDLHGIIFAYRPSPALGDLTRHRNTCSLPFGGRYRMIDFLLSDMVNAGMTDIGLIVHANYQSLLDHVGSGKDWDLSRKRGGLRILPPFSTAESAQGEYRGTMEALIGVSSYLTNIRQQYVVLARGDVALNIDISDVFQHHLARGSDVTVVCTREHSGDSSQCQFLCLDGGGRVTDISVNPAHAPDKPESLELYILSRKLLLELVEDCAAHDVSSFSSGALLPRLARLKVDSYLFDGKAVRFHSVRDYFRHSMGLLEDCVRDDLFSPQRPIRTKDISNPATYYGPFSRSVDSMVADGCLIEGEVEHSILFRGA
ncbi:MAG: glucose-1-phosphate adenylyltransferase subunit GlgD, partial [Selenomonadaceae bacterium]|nr:glucose-1-phosphate adenylyltransferase subunit GlgD [Selenomonadaceae bacterium]